ncbi:MAG: PqqD family protein [Anaerolineae bacterium]|nr:PqqD family protein [Anaerolineae bacterium]
MLTLDSVVRTVAGVATRESGNELVVVSPAQGKYLVLNQTGATVFRLLDGKASLQDIAMQLCQKHQAPLEKAQADVLALVEQLLERGVVSES